MLGDCLWKLLDHTQLDTDTLCRTPPNERQARRSCRREHNTQQTQKTKFHAVIGFRNIDHRRKPTTAEPPEPA
jgi:hypothetical protein